MTGESGDGKREHRSEAYDVRDDPEYFTHVIHLYNNYKRNKPRWSRQPGISLSGDW